MSIAAIASAANSISLPKPAREVTPALGLAFRFTVKIDGLSLGSWSSCGGLKVDFKPTEVRTGGSYLGQRYLPGEATYPRIVLKRAAMKEDSKKVQEFLRDHAMKWVNGDVAATAQGSAGVIKVYDSNDDPVLWIQLLQVRPAAWSGPDLDAGGKVAMESLELVHEGFSVGTGPPAPGPPPTSPSRATLQLKEGAKTVEFRFPPTEIQLMKSQESRTPHDSQLGTTVANGDVQSGDQDVEVGSPKSNVTTYVLNKLFLDGPSTKADVEQLTAWATKPSVTGQGNDALPPLTFSWGTGFQAVKVQLKFLSVTYTRFSSAGVPVRATVGLKLEELVGEAAGQGGANPTSGGPEGRSAHLVVACDTLPAITHAAYGAPTGWREVAEANGIDDPLRLSPGTSLFLPAPSELGTR